MSMVAGSLMAFCLACCQEAGSARTPVPASAVGSVKIEVEGVLIPSTGGNPFPESTVDIGPVPAGETADISLLLTNATGRDIVFEKLVSGCVCGRVSMQGNVLSAEHPTKIIVRYMAPQETFADARKYIHLSFYGANHLAEDQPLAAIYLKTEISGNLSINHHGTSFEINEDGLTVWQLPVHFSLPVRPENLIVTNSHEIRDFQSEIQEQGGRYYLVIATTAGAMEAGKMEGVVTVEDPFAKRKVSVPMLITRRPRVGVSPSLLSVKPDFDNPDLLKGMLFLRVRSKSGENEVPEVLEAACFFGDSRLDIQMTPLRNGIFRVDLTIPAGQFPKNRGQGELNAEVAELAWKIKLSDEERVVTFQSLVRRAIE